ncbi:hypothetical protein DUNSADRAFT_13398 [Dunaliella salina]|uniref:Uncharacterized protein n=1 Tax=Dunaliella salina TaxID=3046 RepID=A0ABQ7H375_DUNSA|nr:hypothetical protein DUNSADRAFT_13398 [Dunaliella salina]|eukprot:KAF5841322.1 hypothetical protein DUNSADRAFT_13398 [Dunaliella salina]
MTLQARGRVLTESLDPDDTNAVRMHQMVEEAAPFNALHLLAVMVKLRPAWMAGQRKLATSLRARWNSKGRIERVSKEGSLGRAQLLESKRLAKCLVSFMHHDRKDVTPLFDLVSITLLRSVVNFAFLEEFCKRVVPEQWSVEEKRNLLVQYVRAFQERSYSQDHLEKILQMLVMPVVTHSMDKQQQSVLDDDLVSAISTHLLGLVEPAPGEADAAQVTSNGGTHRTEEGPGAMDLDAAPATNVKVSDNMLVEFLRLATHILNHNPDLFRSRHRQILAFGWQMLKRENAAVTSQAYLLLAYYMHRFPTTDEVAMQVFASMLRCMQPETKKPVLREAIDMVLPVLHAREGGRPSPAHSTSNGNTGGGDTSTPGRSGGRASAMTTESGDLGGGVQVGTGAGGAAQGQSGGANVPSWVRTMKKVLTEELASLGHMALMWQVVLRHADLFYPHRAQFAPSIVHSLLRLGLQQGTTTENRKLSLDLSMLLIGWEKKMQQQQQQQQQHLRDPQHHQDQPVLGGLRCRRKCGQLKFVTLFGVSWLGWPCVFRGLAPSSGADGGIEGRHTSEAGMAFLTRKQVHVKLGWLPQKQWILCGISFASSNDSGLLAGSSPCIHG